MNRKTLIGLLSAVLVALPAVGQSSGNTGSTRDGEQESVSTGAQMFMGAFQAIRDYGLQAMGDSALWDRAVDGLIRELDDPYAQVFTPEQFDEFQEGNTGNYAGIGVQITNLNEAITITAVFRGTPAERSELQVGDLIIGVNGQSTEGWTTRVASDSIRGEVGTSVRLAIARQGLTAPLTPAIRRDSVHVSAVVSGLVSSDVGYIGLGRVARGSSQEVDSALVKFRSARGVILDLRGNPGGYLDESLMIGDLFLERGARLASAESRVPGEEEPQSRRSLECPVCPTAFPESRSSCWLTVFQLRPPRSSPGPFKITIGLWSSESGRSERGSFRTSSGLTEKRHLRLTTGEWFTPLGQVSSPPPDRCRDAPFEEDPDTFRVVTSEDPAESWSRVAAMFPGSGNLQRYPHDSPSANSFLQTAA